MLAEKGGRRNMSRGKAGLSERIRRAGLTNNVVYARLRRGWDLERALSTPALPHGANQHTAPWRG